MRNRATFLACSCALLMAAPHAALHAQAEVGREADYARIAELSAMEGVWQAEWGSVTRLRAAEKDAPLTEAARSTYEAFQAAKQRGENLQTQAANCRPVDMPGAMRTPYPVEFVYSPGKLNILIETHSQLRQIWTDGRAVPEDPDLLFNGNSVGRWDGEELIVETVGLAPQISLMEGIDPTEQTRIRERIAWPSPAAC